MLLASLRGRPAHGSAIVEELTARSGGTFDLPEGTINPALHRLERQGLIESEWSDRSGRRRRVYRLTRNGQRALRVNKPAYAGLVGTLISAAFVVVAAPSAQAAVRDGVLGASSFARHALRHRAPARAQRHRRTEEPPMALRGHELSHAAAGPVGDPQTI